MNVERRSANDVVILEASGEITYGKGSDVLLRKTVDALFAEGHRKVILDVGGITYVDSAGLGQLAQMHATASKHQAAMRLVRVSKRLRDLLAATRLLPLFQLFETEDAALASFDSAPPSQA
jgi:anti-sigma B factor antagonist